MSPRLCECDYTTRKYNTDGTVVWSANYFDCILQGGTYGWNNKRIECQRIDTTQVYVGGPHVANQDEGWSIVAFSQTDGRRVWSRNLKADMAALSYDTGNVRQIQINPDGNLVAMLEPSSAGTRQAFVVLGTNGSLISTSMMTLSAGYGASLPAMLAFVITDAGDYHMVNGTRKIYDWVTPRTSAPVEYHLGELYDSILGEYYVYGEAPFSGLSAIHTIRRFGGRDYYGFITLGGFGGSSSNSNLVMLRGKASASVPWQTADFDVRINYNMSRYAGGRYTVTDIAVDPATGDHVLMNPPRSDGSSFGGIERYTAGGSFRWRLNCGGHSVAVDTNGNNYAAGRTQSISANQDPSFQSFDKDGLFLWGHRNAQTENDTVCRQVDYCIGDNTIVRSGYAGVLTYRTSGAQIKLLDQFSILAACDTYGYAYGEDPDCSAGNCVYGAYPWELIDPTKSGYVWAYSSASAENPCNTAIGCGCVRDGSGPAFRALYGRPVNSTDTLTIGCCSGTSMDLEVCS